jgi:hypothetical protein
MRFASARPNSLTPGAEGTLPQKVERRGPKPPGKPPTPLAIAASLQKLQSRIKPFPERPNPIVSQGYLAGPESRFGSHT